MNRFLLFLVMLPAGLYRRFGVDLTQLRAILHVRLLMDDRKPRMATHRFRKAKKPTRFSSVLAAIVSLAIGLFYVFFLQLPDKALGITIYYTAFLVFLSLTLVTDFSTVLLDSRDKFIIVPRPVDGRTLFTARLLHILIYLIRQVLPMSLPGWIVFPLLFGWKAALWFPLPVVLITATALFLVLGAYLLILRLASPARFRDWLNGFQVVVSICIFASYYIGPQILRNQQVLNQQLSDHPGLRFAPSYWIASTWSWLRELHFLPHAWLYAVAAIVFPLVCLYLTLRFLAPTFAYRLAAADTVSDAPPATKRRRQAGRPRLGKRLAAIFNRNTESEAGFLLTWYQTGRSRAFRIRVLPTLAYVPVYFVYLLTIGSDNFSDTWENLGSSKQHLTLLYVSSFALLQSLNYIMLSDQYKASWVYYAAPLLQPGRVLAGSLKAVWVKYYLPFFLCIAGFVFYKWGLSVWIDVILALLNASVFVLFVAYLSYRSFPFSKADQMRQKSGRAFRVILVLMVPVALGISHTLAAEIFWLKVLFLALSALLFWLLWGSYINTSWAALEQNQSFDE